jgi:hypothetical protein
MGRKMRAKILETPVFFFFAWPHLLFWQSPQPTMLTKSRIPKQGSTKVKLAPYPLLCNHSD